MTVAESFEQVGDVLNENDFYATRHKYIYRAIEKLAQKTLLMMLFWSMTGYSNKTCLMRLVVKNI